MTKAGLDVLFTIVLVGDSNVGKSSLLSRFANDSYDPRIETTIGVRVMTRPVIIDEQRVKLEIWDTSGRERFRSNTANHLRNADLVIVVYDVTGQSSFDHLKFWSQQIEHYAPQDVQKLMVGNKADMTSKRQVSYIMAEEYAKHNNAPFFETSAQDGSEVEQAFWTAARLLKDRQYQTASELITSTSPAPLLTWANLTRSFTKKSDFTTTLPSRPPASSHTLDGADRTGSYAPSNSEQEVIPKTIRDLERDKSQLQLSLRVVHALLEDTMPQMPLPTYPPVEDFIKAVRECTNVLANSVIFRPSDAFSAELEVARKDTVILIGTSMVIILDEQGHSSISTAGSRAPSLLVRVVSQSSLINTCLNYIVRRTDDANLSADVMASIKYTILQKIANVLKVASWTIPDSTSRNTFERSLGLLIEAADRLRLINSQNPALMDTTVLAPNFALLSALRSALAEELKGEIRQENS